MLGPAVGGNRDNVGSINDPTTTAGKIVAVDPECSRGFTFCAQRASMARVHATLRRAAAHRYRKRVLATMSLITASRKRLREIARRLNCAIHARRALVKAGAKMKKRGDIHEYPNGRVGIPKEKQGRDGERNEGAVRGAGN